MSLSPSLLTVAAAPAEPLVHDHAFERAGLGVAPFHFVTVISLPSPGLAAANPDAYNAGLRDAAAQGRHFGVSVGSCQYCGAALVHNFVIADANQKHAVVGCDCVAKTDHNALYTATEKARRELERQARAAKAEADRETRRLAFVAEQDAARAQFGLTLDELFHAATAAASAKFDAALVPASCSGLLAVLNRADLGNGDFLRSILAELNGTAPGQNGKPKLLIDVPERAAQILAEVYAKTESGKSRRASEWGAAYDEFMATLSAADDLKQAAFTVYQADFAAVKRNYYAAKSAGRGTFKLPDGLAVFLSPEAATALEGKPCVK